MVLGFDIAPEAINEHDDWHTHEHFAERLSIPGFQRASRWVAEAGEGGGPRYFVMYEVADIGILTSQPYLDRLNNPSPWTSKMMPHYRGMKRGFCTVTDSVGAGLGTAALVLRLAPAPGREQALRGWLTSDVLPGLPMRPGLVSAHLFESAAAPPMTNEQKIRGEDAAVAWVLLVTGYDADVVAALSGGALSSESLARQGAAPGSTAGAYRLGLALGKAESGA
jgi:hypothetical protein